MAIEFVSFVIKETKETETTHKKPSPFLSLSSLLSLLSPFPQSFFVSFVSLSFRRGDKGDGLGDKSL